MKRRAQTLALALALLHCLIVSTLLVHSAESNPIGMFPTEPEPLVVTFLSPKNGSRCLQKSMSIAFRLQNPTLGGANSITYLIDGQTKGNVNGVVTAQEGERFVGYFDFVTYSATLELSGLADGWHKLTVSASGTSPYNPTEGGMGSIFAEVYGSDSIMFLYDVVKPSIVILIQQDQSVTSSDVPLNFVLSEDADWIAYSLDQQLPVTIYGNTTLTALPEGLHRLTLYANDTVGRMGNSTVSFRVEPKVEVTVDNQPQTGSLPLLIATVCLMVAAVFTAVVVFYRKKHKKAETNE